MSSSVYISEQNSFGIHYALCRQEFGFPGYVMSGKPKIILSALIILNVFFRLVGDAFDQCGQLGP
jgi:hypothetical protein